MHLAFLGLGQIGGSIARAALRAGFADRVTAWTPNGHGPRAAVADGIVAAPSAIDALDGADLVILAAPPLACLELLDKLAGADRGALGRDTVITDVASTKAAIVARADRHRLRFVGGHPMAGRETAGYGTADPEILRDRPWVVVPPVPGDEEAMDRVVALASACGARPVAMTAVEHDAATASISHLPLVLAAALVEAMTGLPNWSSARPLAAGGWAGMTRLARGEATMGAGILATNAVPTAERLRAIRAVIDEWIALLEQAEPNAGRIRERLAAAARRLADEPGTGGDS